MAIYAKYGCVRSDPFFVETWIDGEDEPTNLPINLSYVYWGYLDNGSPVYTDYEPKTYFGTTNPPPFVQTGDIGYAADEYYLPSDLEYDTTYYLRGWTQEHGYTDVQVITTTKNYLNISDIITYKRLVAAAANSFFYEDI